MRLALFLLLFFLLSCNQDEKGSSPIGVSELPDEELEEVPEISDEDLLDLTQREAFRYFWEFAEQHSGAARERYLPNTPERDQEVVATGGTGFGLMTLIVAMERGFISREHGKERVGRIIDFLETADRFHGAWPHWINGRTGKTIPFSGLDNGGDLVETSFLVQGLICIKEYFKEGDTEEQAIAAKAEALWKGVEWSWFTQEQDVLYWHWSPTFNFDINLELKGYNEVLITYILAASSQDFGIEKEVYSKGWASDGQIKSSTVEYGFPVLVKHGGKEQSTGPLFWAHYSYLGLRPDNLEDAYVHYGKVNQNHSEINYNYCKENPKNFRDYGEDCWGLTASYTRNSDGSLGYSAHSPVNDTGIITPTASVSSIPYTPEASLKALHYFYSHKDKLLGPAGFYDAFSPEFDFWVAEAYLAIDQGPIIIMIENHRTGLLWDLFMQNEEVQQGLNKLGFSY